MTTLHTNISLTTGVPKKCLSCRLDVLVNFGQIFHFFLVLLFLNLNIICLLWMLPDGISLWKSKKGLLPIFIREKLGTSKIDYGTKFRRSYVCLHLQAGNRLRQLANGSAVLRYTMIISIQKLTQVIKSNTAGFLRIQRHNRKILKTILKRPLKQTGIDQKRFTE